MKQFLRKSLGLLVILGLMLTLFPVSQAAAPQASDTPEIEEITADSPVSGTTADAAAANEATATDEAAATVGAGTGEATAETESETETTVGAAPDATGSDGAFQAPIAISAPVYVARGEAAERIARAAAAYNPAQAGSLLLGYPDGSMREDKPISRIETLALLSRAFGALRTPGEHYARLVEAGVEYADIPAWAAADIDNLNAAGILASGGSDVLSADDPVSAIELEIYLRRIWAFLGANPKDDFYAAVNKQTLETAVIQPGDPAFNMFFDISRQNAERLSGIIAEIVGADNEPGGNEAKVAAVYNNIMNYEARNAIGIKPIKPYLDAIEAADSLDALLAVRRQILNDTGVAMLIQFAPQVDLKDSDRYVMTLAGAAISLPKEYYAEEFEAAQQIYIGYLAALLQLTGMDEAAAAESAQLYFQFERDIAPAMMDIQDYMDADKIYNVYTMAQAQKMFPNVDLNALLLEDGYKATDTVIVNDPGFMEAYAAYFSAKGLPALKAAFRLSIATVGGTFLNEEFEKANNEFMQMFLGIQGEKPVEERAAMAVQELLSGCLEEIYIERYFSKEAKADVENMVRSFIAVYKDNLLELDWMSEETKQMAIRKLDTMKLKIGYPDKRDDFLDDIVLKGPGEGGSYYDNICAIMRKQHLRNIKRQTSKVDKTKWEMNAYTVNAYYDPTKNEIVFPAGILQAPFYDIDAGAEANLGGIGFVIAHEITHSFDNNGAKFDENGNAANWWADEDYAVFDSLCEAVVNLYDGYEAAPGIPTNGVLTLSENIADMGALACVIKAARRTLDEPDYKAMFTNLAHCWVNTTYRDYAVLLAQLDVHAYDKVRVNRTLQNCAAFHEAFGVGPGDGMYIAPEDQVNIW